MVRRCARTDAAAVTLLLGPVALPVTTAAGGDDVEPLPNRSVESALTCTRRGKRRMKWIKPKFEIIDLCTEVTLYLYNR